VRVNALLAVLALAGTVFAMMQALVIPALPRIQASLGTNADGAAWISTAYLLSASILTPVIGRLGEVAGKRRMMLASLATFASGTVVCAAAGNLAELVAGRVIQGAAGGIYPLAFAIIRDRLPRERVPGSIGLVSSLLGIGGGLGLVLPGPIMTRLSYQWLFWLPLIVIAAALVLAARAPAASGYIGALILCAAATCAGAFVACATPHKNPANPRGPIPPLAWGTGKGSTIFLITHEWGIHLTGVAQLRGLVWEGPI